MAQEGFLYETNAASALKKKNWVKSDYTPAGASSDRPDLDLYINGKEHGCELKKHLASAGSLVIKYNNATNSFSFGDVGKKKKKCL